MSQPPERFPAGAALTARDDRFRDDPHPVHDALRARAPRHADDEYGRTLLTRFEDVRAALRHKSLAVGAHHAREGSYVRRIAGTGLAERAGETAYAPPLVLLDDPDHRRIRALVSKALNAQSIEAMAPRIAAIAAELLDATRGATRIDFVRDFAGPLPTQVILDMLGMPDAPRADFKRWSEDILFGYDPDRDAATQRRLRDAFLGMGAHIRRTVAERRAAPRADLISAMVRAHDEEGRLGDLEIVSLCTQLMVAGNVTTTDLMANGLHALLTHPEQLAKLRAHPERIDDAVEEMLRFDCPITETARIALADDALNGAPLRRGDTLTASLAAANHDPAVFPEPHRFDLDRPNKGLHLGFGSGVHVCLGAPLARLEARLGLGAFLARHRRIALDAERPWARRQLPFFRGFTTLPLDLTRGA